MSDDIQRDRNTQIGVGFIMEKHTYTVCGDGVACSSHTKIHKIYLYM